MEKRNCYVYVIFRLDGSPCYVGKGTGNRWRHHFKRRDTNPALKAIIDEAGRDLPVVIIRSGLSDDDALKIERAFIWAIGRKNLANRIVGGGGRTLSAEARAKISAVHKGRKKSEEHQAAINKAIRGIPKSPEHLANFRKARLGVPTKPASSERKEKVRQRSLAYWKKWREGGISRRMRNGLVREANGSENR